MTIAKVDEKYQITLPLDVREHLGLKTGDTLDVKIIDGALVMIPLSVPTLSHTDRLYGKHRELWSGEDAVAYIRKERESWRD
ncbi:MAG: AbrB/MazE/SpoVT family DNA-binding domain-containing protein [Hormoscilla sp.]